MAFLNVLKTILTLLPLLIQAVQTIESALPASGQGAAKLALIRETIQAAFTAANDVSITFEAIWPAIQSVIGAVVTLMNSTGAFKKA